MSFWSTSVCFSLSLSVCMYVCHEYVCREEKNECTLGERCACVCGVCLKLIHRHIHMHTLQALGRAQGTVSGGILHPSLMSRSGAATKSQDSTATAFATPPSVPPMTGTGDDKFSGERESAVKKPSAATVLFPESKAAASETGMFVCVHVCMCVCVCVYIYIYIYIYLILLHGSETGMCVYVRVCIY
jgi:hypothetical protein